MRYSEFELLPSRAFQKRAGTKHLATLEGKGSAPTPDYTGAANATAAGNLEAARAATQANRVDQITPYGNLNYTQDPNAGSPDSGWTATTTLSPAEQQKLNSTQALSNGLLDTAKTGLGYVDKTLSTGGALNESQLAQPGISGQTVQDAVMSRLQPQLDRNDNTLRTRLANAGVNEGSEAYKNAMTDQSKSNNDLYTQAALQGINTAQSARQQGIQEQYTAQDRPLNIVNALRTGNQVQTPQFTNVPQQQTTAGADLLGAATATGQYNSAQAASRNAGVNSVLNSLIGAGGMYLGGL